MIRMLIQPNIAYTEGMKKLVIVESPAKAKTIAGVLGRDYTVRASLGHVRDLPDDETGRRSRAQLQADLSHPARQIEDDQAVARGAGGRE